jgi:hypothetical protein
MPVCIDVPAHAGSAVVLPVDAFTLAWTHSVEQTTWQEDWRVDGGRLRLVGAAVAGSGAGMEPGAGASLQEGVWRWTPQLAPVERLVLARLPAQPDWQLCWQGSCGALSGLIPAAPAGPVSLYACDRTWRPSEQN